MFYVAFVTYESLAILQEVLDLLNDYSSSKVWVQFRNEIYPYTPNCCTRFPFFENKYLVPQEWCIRSEQNSYSEDNIHFKFLPREVKSIGDAEKLFDDLSKHFGWCIFTWGGVSSLLSVGFISNNVNSFEYFLSAYRNVFKKRTLYKVENPLISKYFVSTKFSDKCRILLFNLPNNNLGSRIWQACNCDLENPWLITNIDYSQENGESLPMVQELNFFVQGDNDKQVRKRNLKIFEIKTLELFERACGSSCSFSPTAVAVASKTRLEALQSILARTEMYDCDNHDLQCVDDITNHCKWFYGIGRDFTDAQNSIFLSKDSILLSKIDSMHLDDNYQFISCF